MQPWNDFVQALETELGQETSSRWLRPLRISHFDAGNLYLIAKDSIHLSWFEEHVRPRLKKLLNNNQRPIKVHIRSGDEQLKKKPEKPEAKPPLTFTFPPLNPHMTLSEFLPGEANAFLFKLFSELTTEQPNEAVAKLACPGKSMILRSGCQGLQNRPVGSDETNLHKLDEELPGNPAQKDDFNGRWSFAIASNPIFIYGEPATGKTHLLTAAAHLLREKGRRVIAVHAETFTEHVVAAIRQSSMDTFRAHYRNVDALIVDDVHLFARRAATQEEFFHTFNALHTAGKQILLSSHSQPTQLADIEPRLTSRFEWGIALRLEKLGDNELAQLLSIRLKQLQIPASAQTEEFLLSHFGHHQKKLLRAIDALALRTKSSQNINTLLADLVAEENKNLLTVESLIQSVASHFGLKTDDILGKSQSHERSFPRQIAMYLCRHELKLPFLRIGKIFSRDHSTVMTSVKHIQKKHDTDDKQIARTLSEIKKSFQ